MREFALRLKQLRVTNRLTQQQLADEIKSLYSINMSKQQISFYEKDQRYHNSRTLQKFAEFFNVTTDYLMGIENLQFNKYLSSLNNKSLELFAIYETLNDSQKKLIENIINSYVEINKKNDK